MTKPRNGKSTKSARRSPRLIPNVVHDMETKTRTRLYVQQFCKMAGHVPATYRLGDMEFTA
jgi:hypothetical protein